MTLSCVLTMEGNINECIDSDSWRTVYAECKRKILDTNLLIEKCSATTQENTVLIKKVNDTTTLLQSLKADCEKYEKDLQNALQNQAPLKQLCASLKDQLHCHEQEKESLTNSLESYKASVRQYEGLLKQKQQEVQSAQSKRGRTDTKDKVSVLEKKVHEGGKELRRLQRKCNKARTLFKLLDSKLNTKGVLTAVERRHLKRAVSLLESANQDLDSGDGVSSEEDVTKNGDNDDAEYLEKLLMNGDENLSDSESNPAVSHSHSVGKQENAVCDDNAESDCLSLKKQKPKENEKPGERVNDNAESDCLSLKKQKPKENEKPGERVNDNGKENKEQMALGEKQGSAYLEDRASGSSEEQHASLLLGSELGPPVKDCGDFVETVDRPDPPCTETSERVQNAERVHDSSNKEQDAEHESESRKQEKSASDIISADCDMNKDVPVSSSDEQPVDFTSLQAGQELVCESTKIMEPLECAVTTALPYNDGSNTGKKCLERHEEVVSRGPEMESVREELKKIASEMHLTSVCSVPLSPLPPSPPTFEDECDALVEDMHCNTSSDSLSISACKYKDSLPSGARSVPKSSPLHRTHSISRKEKCKKKNKSLPFSNMVDDPSNNAAFGRKPFHHQQSEGFEPHMEEIELENDQHSIRTSAPSCSYPSESRKVKSKFWHSPVDGMLHIKAGIPKVSVTKRHIVPLIAVDLDPDDYDFHLAYGEIPVSQKEIQGERLHQPQCAPEQEEYYIPTEPTMDVPSALQTQPSVQPLVKSSVPATRSPIPHSQPRCTLGQKQKTPARIPPVSFVCPGSMKRPDAMHRDVPRDYPNGVPGLIPNASFQTPPLSPLPPTPQKQQTPRSSGETRVCLQPALASALKKPGQRKLAAIGQVPRVLEEDAAEQQQNRNIETRRVSFGFNAGSGATNLSKAEQEEGESTVPSSDEKLDEDYVLPVSKKQRISLLSTKSVKRVPKFVPFVRAGNLADSRPVSKVTLTPEKEGIEKHVSTGIHSSSTSGTNDQKPSADTVPQQASNLQRRSMESCENTDLTPATNSVSDVVSPPTKKRRISHIPMQLETLKSPDVMSPLSGSSFEFPPPESPTEESTAKSKDPLKKSVPAPPFSIFVTSPRHKFLTNRARGNLVSNATVKLALEKLAWLATKHTVVPEAVQGIAHSLKSLSDAVALTVLSYLGNTTANPFLGYMRKEVIPPLLTPTEALMLQCFNYVEEKRRVTEGIFNLLLAALRARLFSNRRPKTLLGMTAYCRMIAGICRRMGDLALLRVIFWDIMQSFCGNAPFLLASIVGVWPEVLSSYRGNTPSDAVLLGLRYLLFHAPHTLNSTLCVQVQIIFQELGNLCPLDAHLNVSDVAEALLNAMDAMASAASEEELDKFLLHCLTLEEVCRRSNDWQWVVSVVLKKLWPLVGKLMTESDAVRKECLCTVATLLGGIWRRFPAEENLSSLKTYVEKIETILQENETDFAVQEAFAKSVLLLPSVERWESLLSVIRLWQENNRDEVLKLKPVEPISAKARGMTKKIKKTKRAAAQLS